MTCDQVFNILTRGPFPTGDPHDYEVEAHLERCPDCGRLADALRPALDVFQEAVPPAESRDLPGYWCDTVPASAVVAELTRETARTAQVLLPRRSLAGMPLRQSLPHEGNLLRDVFTVVGFITVLSITVVGVAYLLRMW